MSELKNNNLPQKYEENENDLALGKIKNKFQDDVIKCGYYTVAGGKRVENASLINAMAVKSNIKTRVETWKNSESAGCNATCWIGNESNPIALQTKSVIHYYKDKYEEKLLEYIKNNSRDYTDKYGKLHKKTIDIEKDITFELLNGVPFPKIISPSVHLNFLLEWNRFKCFSERDAETKAIARSQKALLGIEFRDEDEIESEEHEIEMVQDSQEYKNNNKNIDNNKHNNKSNNKIAPTNNNNNKDTAKSEWNTLMYIIKDEIKEKNLDNDIVKEIMKKHTGKESFKDNTIDDLKIMKEKIKTYKNENIQESKDDPKEIFSMLISLENPILKNYIDSFEIYFKNHSVLNEDDRVNILMNTTAKQKKERADIEVYKTILNEILKDEKSFIDKAKNLNKELK
jgi:hypothetical protein